jgi:hypothetical protein
MRWIVGAVVVLVLGGLATVLWTRREGPPHSLIIFVADGLRSQVVTDQNAPELAELRRQGVDLRNSHAAYPTVTTVNASTIATGHWPGDTGDFGNMLYAGAEPMGFPVGGVVGGLENDEVLGLMNRRFGGDYLNETTVLQAARAQGYSTAAVGKVGPIAIQDVSDRSGKGTVVIDDSTGWTDSGETGIGLAPDVAAAIRKAGLPAEAPDRGLNTWPGTFIAPGVQVANVEQQNWFVAVATKVLLPRFKAAHKPFVMVFWSRDPDGTQHNEGDSLNTLTPGINGPTTMAAIRNASHDLGALRAALKRLHLDGTTNIIVTADHGFSTTSKQSATSGAAKAAYLDVPKGFLPPGFLAIDLAQALKLPLYDTLGLPVAAPNHPKDGALLGADPKKPEVVIAANGGSDLIYLPGPDRAAMARRIADVLTRQDYTAALFVDDVLGPVPGALPLSAIGLKGSARTPTPAMIVAFRSFSTGCAKPDTCAVDVADTGLQQGEGIHGSFSRADTHNFMAAIGPDFKRRFVDPAPVGNPDVGMTAAHLLGLDVRPKGKLTGRVMTEALKGSGAAPAARPVRISSRPAANGFVTVLDAQDAAGRRYFDAAGAPGRVFGLRP